MDFELMLENKLSHIHFQVPLLLFLLLLLTALSLAAIIVVRGALALQHRVVVR